MKKLFVYMKGYWAQGILSPLFKMLEACFELFVPLVVADIIDNGIALGGGAYILQKCVLLVTLTVVGMVSSITAQYFAAKAAVGFTKNLRNALFAHIQSLSYKELDQLGASTLMTRMTSDVNQLQTGVNLAMRLLLRSPFVVFGAMIMAFTVDVKAALLFAAAIPLLAAVVFFIMLKCIPMYKQVQRKLDGIMGLTKENLSGARVIRAFGFETDEVSDFGDRTQALADAQLHVGRIAALMNPVTYVIINLAVIALIWTGALQVDAGVLTQGEVVALYNYMSQILVELIKMATLLINISRAIACGKRISAMFDVQPSLHVLASGHAAAGGDVAVEFRHASLRYPENSADSLHDVHVTVRRGETIGIIGGTGSGKTSLVNLIPRFYDVTAGEVLVDGRNVKTYPLDELRGKIGVVPQQALLFKGTLRENMLWGKADATDDDILRALELAQAKAFVLEKEGGLHFAIEQGGKNLSGGQRQRLTIARALLREPDILILDDSASALDYATDARLRKAIRALTDTTIFIVSQRASSIQHADRILVLDDGHIVGSGTSDYLLENCPVYRAIHDIQFAKEGAANA